MYSAISTGLGSISPIWVSAKLAVGPQYLPCDDPTKIEKYLKIAIGAKYHLPQQ